MQLRRLPKINCEEVYTKWRGKLINTTLTIYDPPARDSVLYGCLQAVRIFGMVSVFESDHICYLASPEGHIVGFRNATVAKRVDIQELFRDQSIIKFVLGNSFSYGQITRPSHIIVAEIWEQIESEFIRFTGTNASTRQNLDTRQLVKKMCGVLWSVISLGAFLLSDKKRNAVPCIRYMCLKLAVAAWHKELSVEARTQKLVELVVNDCYYHTLSDMDMPSGYVEALEGVQKNHLPVVNLWQPTRILGFLYPKKSTHHFTSSRYCRLCCSALSKEHSHTPADIERYHCHYPLCEESMEHSILTCNQLAAICSVCNLRGHSSQHHDSWVLPELMGFFMQFARYHLKAGLLFIADHPAFKKYAVKAVYSFDVYVGQQPIKSAFQTQTRVPKISMFTGGMASNPRGPRQPPPSPYKAEVKAQQKRIKRARRKIKHLNLAHLAKNPQELIVDLRSKLPTATAPGSSVSGIRATSTVTSATATTPAVARAPAAAAAAIDQPSAISLLLAKHIELAMQRSGLSATVSVDNDSSGAPAVNVVDLNNSSNNTMLPIEALIKVYNPNFQAGDAASPPDVALVQQAAEQPLLEIEVNDEDLNFDAPEQAQQQQQQQQVEQQPPSEPSRPSDNSWVLPKATPPTKAAKKHFDRRSRRRRHGKKK